MQIKHITWAEEPIRMEGFAAVNDEGVQMSTLGFNTVMSRYSGKYIPTVTISGVATDPRFRRGGNVRVMLEKVFSMAPERGWAVSMLHPFSMNYYRKFGYEKIADHKTMRFPMRALSHIPRCESLRLVEDEAGQRDAMALYNAFGDNRNIMFPRPDGTRFPLDAKEKTYIWYDAEGKPASYVKLWGENYYSVNRMVSVDLHIEELVFTTPASLRALFGFMRMFEGELETVNIHNCAMAPEVDGILREYMDVEYTLIPDIMARILDVKAVLEAKTYPDEPGSFRVFVEDSWDFTRGLYQVDYAGGEGKVTRLPDDGEWDIRAEMPAFTQLIYGYQQHTAASAAFLEGVELNNDCPDFFRAFGQQYNGLFEHF